MSDTLLGATLQNRYRIDAELGRGGVGVVYRAQDMLLNRQVAIKVLSASGLGTVGKNRLLSEAQAVASLNHPNIVAVYDAGEYQVGQEESATPFIVMELIEGQSLRKHAPQSLAEVVAIGRQICTALEHAHNNGIIHRDLKPENIVITSTQAVKLMDFGLARTADAPHLTEEGTIVGTFFYLAPELIVGQPASPLSDLYALGILLYELAAGRPPFAGDSLMSVLSQHLHAPVVPASTYNAEIPPALDAVILRLLSKQPEDRPASVAEVRQVLEQLDTAQAVPVEDLVLEPSQIDRLVRGRMVGRRREFGEAKAAWQQARTGEGQVLLVSGEPGIGKTRLVRELTTLAEVSGGYALIGESYVEGGAPYAPVAQVIRAAFSEHTLKGRTVSLPEFVLADLITLAPDLRVLFPAVPPNPMLDPQAEQQRLYESVVTLCTALAAEAPLLVVVDDAHWADSGTLFLLHHLARRLRSARLLLVLTYREVELDEARALNDILLTLNRERLATRIKLARLDREQTRDLLAAMFQEEITPEFLEGIYRETEGNPFFIEEVCKALIEEGKLYRKDGHWQRPAMSEMEIPQSVRLAVQARIGKLPEEAQDVLRLAAIIGREFDFATLLKSSDANEETLIEALETAERAQLITEARRAGHEVFTFAHALIPATLRESLSSLRRHRLHRRVAATVEVLRPDDFETLAYHYNEGGDGERAGGYYAQAGERALAAYANQDAEKHLRSALELSNSRLEQAHLLARLGEALSRQSRYKEASQTWQRAIELYEGQGADDQICWLYARLGRAVAYSGDLPGSLACCRQGLAATAGQPDSVGMAALLHEAARSSRFNGLADDALDLCQRALAMARQLGAVKVEAEALATLGILPGHTPEASQAILRQSATLAEANGLLETAARAYNNLANSFEESGDLARAREYYQRAGDFCRRRGSASEELFVMSQVADVSLWLGDFALVEEMLPNLRQLLQNGTGMAAGGFSLRHAECLLLRYRGEWPQALEQFRAFQDDMRQRSELQQLRNASFYLGEALLELGDLAEAEKALAETIQVAWDDHDSRAVWAACLLAVVYAYEGRPAEATRQLEEVRARLGEAPSPFNTSYLRLAEASVAQGEGDWPQAMAAYEAAVAIMERMGIRWYQAWTLRQWAGAYLARGEAKDLEQAARLMKEARQLFESMRLPNYVNWIDRQLRKLAGATATPPGPTVHLNESDQPVILA
ncbi:MAG: protein kinase [Chloroflexi bacterium]|nr:protein kinase [Chloroflexota bacterium]MCI0646195.1 protein kinase [Chloroflexota bacterium]